MAVARRPCHYIGPRRQAAVGRYGTTRSSPLLPTDTCGGGGGWERVRSTLTYRAFVPPCLPCSQLPLPFLGSLRSGGERRPGRMICFPLGDAPHMGGRVRCRQGGLLGEEIRDRPDACGAGLAAGRAALAVGSWKVADRKSVV